MKLKSLTLVLSAALLGCSDATDPGVNARLEVISGADQVAGAGAAGVQPVVVRVVSEGRPVSGVDVHWRVLEGGGMLDQAASRTDSDGRASVTWALGEELGPQLLLATYGNASITIRATTVFQIASIAAGFRHVCVLSATGEAYCAGANNDYQLGDGTNTARANLVRVNTGVRFSKLSAGWAHTCGLSREQSVFCWGDNSAGQLGVAGIPRSGIPVAVPFGAMKDVAAGYVHTCAVTAAGASRCWGSNAQGQLGSVAAMDLQAVVAGEFHSCGLRTDSTAVCWGWNSNGQLGTNAPLGAIVATPTPLFFNHRYRQLAAGVRHTCAAGADGRAYCWGRNAAGENGQDPGIQIAVPVAVGGTQNMTQVGAGNIHSCGLSGGRAFCWGAGHGKTPVPVATALQFTAISAGYDQTCGIANNEVWCWDAGATTPRRIVLP